MKPDKDCSPGYSPNMKVRPAKLPEEFEKIYALNVIISPDEDQNYLKNEIQNFKGSFFVAEEDDKIIGFASLSYPYWDQIGLILHLAVEKQNRSKGIGSALIGKIVEEAKKSKLRFITVRTAAWNSEAIKFYEKCGFIQKAKFDNNFWRWQHHDLVRPRCTLKIQNPFILKKIDSFEAIQVGWLLFLVPAQKSFLLELRTRKIKLKCRGPIFHCSNMVTLSSSPRMPR